MSSPLQNNITNLQNLLEQVNALPEEVILPELTNPANAEELFANKELIDADGNIVTGTFTIDNELSAQDNLITQIQTALQNKASGGSGDGGDIETCIVNISFNYGDPKAVLISGTQLVDNVVQPFVIDTYNGGDTFSSPYSIVNIIKNSPLMIAGDGAYVLGAVKRSGCELLCRSGGMKCVLLKITDSNASVTINNDY